MCHLRRKPSLSKALRISVTVIPRDGSRHTLKALIDTGAEYNLCNPQRLSTTLWEVSPNPIVLLAANESVVAGGSLELTTRVEMQVHTKGGTGLETLTLPATFYQAEVGTPLILSYGWLAEHGIIVCPAGEVLLCHGRKHISWVWGQGVQPIPWRPREIALGRIPGFPPQQPPAMGTTLSVPIRLHTTSSGVRLFHGLVDTGAEYNLCRIGLLPAGEWKKAEKPLRFYAADQSPLGGGERQMSCRVTLEGQYPCEPHPHECQLSADFYEADIQQDVILSYTWMAQHGVSVCPAHNAILIGATPPPLWVKGAGHTEEIPPCQEDSQVAMVRGRSPQRRVSFREPIQEEEWYPPSQMQHPTLDEHTGKGMRHFAQLGLRGLPGHQGNFCDAETLVELVRHWSPSVRYSWACGVVTSSDPQAGAAAQQLRDRLLTDYKGTVFDPSPLRDPPKRGPLGEAELILKDGTQPIGKRPYQVTGERLEALKQMIQELLDCGKIERCTSAWASPAFPVAKKEPGKFRLVVDYRGLNEVTMTDSSPLPRIDYILQNQGKYKMWSVLDMKDGFHQIPLKDSSRDYTCMSTPLGLFRWKVLPMGLKNGNAIFQRVMDWVLRDQGCANAYIDDVIIGSTGGTPEEVLANHDRDLRQVLDTLGQHQMRVNMKKPQLFMNSVQFCGHILVEGKRFPAPDKLSAIKDWELPKTVTALRGFLGLANYYSSYVPHFAEHAAPLTSMLQLNRQDGKKGSKKALQWSSEAFEAFHRLKKALTDKLEVFQLDLNKPFYLRTDASRYAVGAVLEQLQDGQRVPVSFFSRKLTTSQRNWTPREQETYAIVAALRKWAGWIGFQPVVILTDHRALEHWVTEHVDTPSGPAGRRARWHETMSKFDLKVEYVPGKDNVVADALSRWAYPASAALQDCSWHGSAQDWAEMQKIMAEELAAGKMVGLIPSIPSGGVCLIMGALPPRANMPSCVMGCYGISTRQENSSSRKEGRESVTPPLATTERQETRSQPQEKEEELPYTWDTQVEIELGEGSGSEGDAPTPEYNWATAETRKKYPESRTTWTREQREWVRREEAADSQRHSPESSGEDGVPNEDRSSSSQGGHVTPPHQPAPMEHAEPPTPPDGWLNTGRGGQEEENEEDPPAREHAHQSLEQRSKTRRNNRRQPQVRVEAPPPETQPQTEAERDHVMDIDWAPFYKSCPETKAWWQLTEQDNWPHWLRVEETEPGRKKIFYKGKVVVPGGLVKRVLMAHHQEMGHMGINKMEKDSQRTYWLCIGSTPCKEVIREVKAQCQVCQACEPPNWSTRGPIEMTPVPDRCMVHVAIDLFSIAPTTHQGHSYDSILVCVDRLSGWTIAVPCEKKGLTSEKAAQLMLEKWEMFGIPEVITSDQGQHFVGAWWQNMCARLGVRQAHGIAYRSQTNGRAEVAGKTIIHLLRKLHIEQGLNWVEALPRVLRHHHDAVNDTGLSPYQILFGRDRPMGALRRGVSRECEDAQAFMDRMGEVDQLVAKTINTLHYRQADRLNKGRERRPPFQVGDWVWIHRPKGITGPKLDTVWLGPGKVLERLGNATYRVQLKPNHAQEVHLDQMKPHVADTITGRSYELYTHKRGIAPLGVEPDEWLVQDILGHRRGKNGQWEFLTHWEGYDRSEATWEPTGNFILRFSAPWVRYCHIKGLYPEMTKILRSIPREEA